MRHNLSSTTSRSTNRLLSKQKKPTATITHLGLRFRVDHYYLKRPRIVEKIRHDNRIFYAKFERIDAPPNDTVVQQHLTGDYTIAFPLLDESKHTDYLVIDYKGEESGRFVALAKAYMHQEKIDRFGLYYGKEKHRVQLFIPVSGIKLEEAEARLKKISELLEKQMSKSWKTLPSSALPRAYNIVTLPYEAVEDAI